MQITVKITGDEDEQMTWRTLLTDLSKQIRNVYFNRPVTVVLWEDGSKTIVRCGTEDTWDEEKGLAMAILKKYFGSKEVFRVFDKYIPYDKSDK